LGAAFVEDATSAEFSRFTNGLREAIFLVSGTGASSVAFVVAARALVVLAVGGATVFVRVEARVPAVGFAAIVLQLT